MKRIYVTLVALALLAGCNPANEPDPSTDRDTAMQLIRGPFVAPERPADVDPDNPLNHPAGWFQTDPTEPPTAVTPEWANQVQGELVGLQAALGASPIDRGDQLAGLYEQGLWTPVLLSEQGTARADVAYDVQEGEYMRIGRFVFVTARMKWVPDQDINEDVRIPLPWKRIINGIISGAVDGSKSTSRDEVAGTQRATQMDKVYLTPNSQTLDPFTEPQHLKVRANIGNELTNIVNGADVADMVVGDRFENEAGAFGSALGFWALYRTTGERQLVASVRSF